MRAVAYVVLLNVILPAPALAEWATSSTRTNLQAAFEAELNAAERSSSFAQKAEQEGLPAVGRLFRAIARGEEIHARNHENVLRALGARPKAVVVGVEVKSTRENLRVAIEEEKLDRDGRYPSWLGAAREIGDSKPVATLGVAMFVERAHLLLLEQALRDLDAPVAANELCVSRRSGYVSPCDHWSALAYSSPAHSELEHVE